MRVLREPVLRRPSWQLGLALALSLASASSWGATPPEASGSLEASHWAVRAVQRLQDLGLVEGYLPAQNAVPRAVVRGALEQAVALAPARAPQAAALARGYLTRFEQEFRSRAATVAPALVLHQASASLGYRGTPSRFDAAVAQPRPGFIGPGPEVSLPGFSAELAANVTSHLGLSAQPMVDPDGIRLPRWEAVAALNPISLSFGRASVGYGLEGERGFVVAGAQSFDRLELATSRPLVLPGFLRHVGPVAFQGFVSRLTEPRHAGEPFFWGGNLRVQPHSRLTLSLQRAVIVGGGRFEQGTKLNQVFKMLFGTRNQQENNLAGLSARWRLPTESLLPLTTYAEWAMDDLGGEIEAPGLLFGLRTPMVPGAPAVSLGAEFAFMGALCCSTERPSWYLHFNHAGGWVMQDAPIGHALGGDGREYRVYGALDLLETRLRVEGAAFIRQRFAQNLYAPQRWGESTGASSRVLWRLSERTELALDVAAERGSGWREGSVQGRAAFFF